MVFPMSMPSKRKRSKVPPSRCGSSQEAALLKHHFLGPVNQSSKPGAEGWKVRACRCCGHSMPGSQPRVRLKSDALILKGPLEPQLDPGNMQELQGNRKEVENKSSYPVLKVCKVWALLLRNGDLRVHS